MYRHQFEAFSNRYRCISYDHRGHGRSAKPTHGYRIQRFSQDLKELMDHLEIQDVVILGHSMGNSVIWGYIDLYGQRNISKFIINDQSPAMVTAGQVSIVPWKSQEWIHQQIPGSSFQLISKQDHGHHFAFLHNHQKYNALLAEFLAAKHPASP
jgi:alpha-beta hydrolase superfamily lysophospholipase